ncbi:MAG: VTT domain-containing protein [Acutalibacteraceae bacterium]
MKTKGKLNTDKLIKALQIVAILLMVVMVVFGVLMMRKYNISLKNVQQLAEQIRLLGALWMVALILIVFSVVKSFALVFPPAVLFALTGILFRGHLVMAWLINLVATALSLILPYYLGKFTGKSMVDTLKKKFKAVQKIDNFAGQNDFTIVFLIKASGCMPSDVSSLIFGAMDLPFARYFLAANVGMLPLNLLWTLLGAKGDVSNPLSFLYVLPILLFAVIAAVVMGKINKKKNASCT